MTRAGIRKLPWKTLSWLGTEDGQTVVEYVLVLVIIVFVLLYAFETSNIELAISNSASKVAEKAAAGVANIGGL